MSDIVFRVEEAPDGCYTARAVGHSIFTEADTFEELREMAREAVLTHFDPTDAARLVSIRLHLGTGERFSA